MQHCALLYTSFDSPLLTKECHQNPLTFWWTRVRNEFPREFFFSLSCCLSLFAAAEPTNTLNKQNLKHSVFIKSNFKPKIGIINFHADNRQTTSFWRSDGRRSPGQCGSQQRCLRYQSTSQPDAPPQRPCPVISSLVFAHLGKRKRRNQKLELTKKPHQSALVEVFDKTTLSSFPDIQSCPWFFWIHTQSRAQRMLLLENWMSTCAALFVELLAACVESCVFISSHHCCPIQQTLFYVKTLDRVSYVSRWVVGKEIWKFTTWENLRQFVADGVNGASLRHKRTWKRAARTKAGVGHHLKAAVWRPSISRHFFISNPIRQRTLLFLFKKKRRKKTAWNKPQVWKETVSTAAPVLKCKTFPISVDVNGNALSIVCGHNFNRIFLWQQPSCYCCSFQKQFSQEDKFHTVVHEK